MNLRKIASVGKRVALSLTLTGAMLYGGGCSLRSMGAYMLSDFLTSGGSTGTSETTGTTSGLESLIGDLLGAAT